MLRKTIISFPYGGFESDSDREAGFWYVVDVCQTVDDKPIVILNRDTERRNRAEAFLQHSRRQEVELLRAWSVDTCQMWLVGWGHILDEYGRSERAIHLPGDIANAPDDKRFDNALKAFVSSTFEEIILGDFDTRERYGGKELIDTYGTYPLLANWFPDVSKAIKAKNLTKPRTEFTNIATGVLSDFLKERKFAYEQTLNMLLHAFDTAAARWSYAIGVQHLGKVLDDSSFRQYGSCIDQIERTERLLKMVWRELNEPDEDHRLYRAFTKRYHELDKSSTGIRETARITIAALLGA